MARLLAGGHLLIEDLPGVGKTTLAHALAVSLGLQIRALQFTPDLMPSDLLGVSVYERSRRSSCSIRGRCSPGAARRRDQPRRAEDAERAARGDGGAAGHDRRQPRPAAVLRHRDAEPERPARHLSAARVATGPLPDVHHARLPRPGLRARCCSPGRTGARGDRTPADGDDAGGTAGGAAGGARGARPGGPASTTCRR